MTLGIPNQQITDLHMNLIIFLSMMVEWSTLAQLVKQSTAIKAYFAYPLPVGINAMRSTSYMENGHDKEFTVSFLGGM